MIWDFVFILKWEHFLFTSSLKTKNCFCKEMRFFLTKMPCWLTMKSKSPQFFNRLLQAICYILFLCKSFLDLVLITFPQIFFFFFLVWRGKAFLQFSFFSDLQAQYLVLQQPGLGGVNSCSLRLHSWTDFE